MCGLRSLAVLTIGLTLSACDEPPGGFSSASGQGIYPSPAYYPSPGYAPGPYVQPGYAPGPFVQPGYAVPYGYQPGYGRPYYGGGQEYRHDHDERQRSYEQTRPNNPPMAAQPRSLPPPRTAGPAPVATPQAAHNAQLLNQLGFKPSQ